MLKTRFDSRMAPRLRPCLGPFIAALVASCIGAVVLLAALVLPHGASELPIKEARRLSRKSDGNEIPPSWIPGLDGIDPGLKRFTYTRDALEACVLVLIGAAYKSRITDRRPPFPPRQCAYDAAAAGFAYGRFACRDSPSTFCWSFFLTQVRMGDTLRAAGVAGFWAPMLVFFASRVIANAMGEVPGMVAGLPTTSMLFFQACFYAKWRRDLRVRFSLVSAASCTEDYLLYACCAPCLSTQEAREVDMANGVRVRGCASLEIVGEPVAVHP